MKLTVRNHFLMCMRLMTMMRMVGVWEWFWVRCGAGEGTARKG